eukprot:11567329-Alexandrium_andersonii.AAC.1
MQGGEVASRALPLANLPFSRERKAGLRTGAGQAKAALQGPSGPPRKLAALARQRLEPEHATATVAES